MYCEKISKRKSQHCEAFKSQNTDPAPIMLDFILAFMEASPGKCDVSCVRTLISVWAPTSQKTREKAVQLFGDGVLYVEYSATEIGVAICLKPDEVLKYPASCGRTAMGQEIKIVDMNGKDLPRGEVGEIVVAGQMVTGGYLVPKSIDFVADFPRTAAGKVQKSLLRKTYWEGAGRKI